MYTKLSKETGKQQDVLINNTVNYDAVISTSANSLYTLTRNVYLKKMI